MPILSKLATGALLLAAALPHAYADASAPLADDPTLIALAVSLSCANAPEQDKGVAPAPAGPTAAGPELELVATVRAKELRFETVPHVQVAFKGNGPRHTTWKTERVNLPMHPEPGVAYHDVALRLTISSTLDELPELLAQAKRASGGIKIEPDVSAPPASSPAPAPGSASAPAAPAPAPAADTSKR
jgi:hypothetical protein